VTTLRLFQAAVAVLCASVALISQSSPTAPRPAPEAIVREIKLVALFDRNADGRLDAAERKNAREHVLQHPELKPPRRNSRFTPGTPGPKVAPSDVPAYQGRDLYDQTIVRTLFLEFEDGAWEKELADFHGTDVDVPAMLTVDGQRYPGVGVHFRGHNSFLAVPEGRKRPLTISIDYTDESQRLLGYRGLHLLNGYVDPTLMRGVLYLDIARQYIAAPKANFVQVVINGESWGLYVNQQRFDTDFLRDHYKTTKGTRWRSLNNAPGGGLSYLGEELGPYKEAYEIKSKDSRAAWTALRDLCRVLNETPPEKLAPALAPVLDIDTTLKWLALDNVLMNGDGYWEDGSDFNLYTDERGRLSPVPYDVNEAFRPLGGRRGGPPAVGVALDPFAMADDPRKAVIGKLLAAPDVRQQYVRHVRTITERSLDWKVLGPKAAQFEKLIADAVARDTRKLYSTEEFAAGTGLAGTTSSEATSIREFVEQRRAFLLHHAEIAGRKSRVPNRR
jgi:hypothetical protein